MTGIIVLSDTHGNRRAIDSLKGVLDEADVIIHLGDTSADGQYTRSQYPNKTYVVNGNCDAAKLGEDELVLNIEGVKIFAAHGHLYGVKYSAEKLVYRAKELGCNVALYGHSHRAAEEDIGGVLTVNPGCMTRYSQQSYCYLAVNGNKAVAKIVNI